LHHPAPENSIYASDKRAMFTPTSPAQMRKIIPFIRDAGTA